MSLRELWAYTQTDDAEPEPAQADAEKPEDSSLPRNVVAKVFLVVLAAIVWVVFHVGKVLFYAGGDYEARRGSGIEQGSISLHPSGFTHGPQPGAVERALGAERFEELAVMVDTFRPLSLAPAGLACEDPGYAWTWAR